MQYGYRNESRGAQRTQAYQSQDFSLFEENNNFITQTILVLCNNAFPAQISLAGPG